MILLPILYILPASYPFINCSLLHFRLSKLCEIDKLSIKPALMMADNSKIAVLDVSLQASSPIYMRYVVVRRKLTDPSELHRRPTSILIQDSFRCQSCQRPYLRTNRQRARPQRSSRCRSLLWPSTSLC